MPPTSGVKIKLGGKRRTLRLTVRALDRLETETGLTWPQMSIRVQHGSMKHFVWALWGMLIHDAPDLERDTVIDWIDEMDEAEQQGLADTLERAIREATGADSEEEEGEGNAEAAA